MKTFKLKSILFGLIAVLAIAIMVTSCEQKAIDDLTEEAIKNSQLNTEAGQSCSGCMQFSHEEPDEIIDVFIKYSENGEPVIEKAARYGEVVVYGGDVVLTENYSTEISLRGNIISDFSRVWPNSTIPYVWGDGLSQAQRDAILIAIADVNEKTNLCVVERTNEADFVQFRNAGGGCYVFRIGNDGRENQVINLSTGCFSKHTIVHEILHKAGFYHEQTRPDRDNFITVNWGNLDGANWTAQFQRQGGETNSGTYDFASVMHYPQFHSSVTIDDTQPMYFINNPNSLPGGMTANQIGKLQDMSATDIASVNTLYSIACGGTPPPTNCEILTNGGFDSNVSNWESWNCNASSSGGVANLTNISTGVNPWSAGLVQVGFTIEQGKTYTATFRARAASDRSIFVKTGTTGTPWTSYFYKEVNLTTSMQTFAITFTMNNPTDTNARFEFFVGTDSPNVYIENVSLKESNCGGNNCPSAGTSCDDDNSATYNDVEDGNCNCVGTPCPSVGTYCNDGNPNTVNDVEDGFCNCVGAPIQTGNCEVLTNGSFDSNVSSWESWNCNAYSSNGTANITGITTGADVWNAGLLQRDITLQQGKTYTVTFRARASSNRSIIYKTGLSEAPWTSYFYETANLSTSMQTYTHTFTMNYATNTNARFEFFLGNNSSNVYIEDVSLEENNCGTTTTCEVLTNGSFNTNVSGWEPWNCNASASGGAANITGISTGADPWDAGLNQVGFTVEQGKTYTVTFRARAASNRPIVVKTGMTGTPWTSYFYKTVNLSTSMQTYTITFTMNYPTDTNARFEFFLGTDSPNVYIDNVSMSSGC